MFLARLKQLRRNKIGGRHDMCYFGAARAVVFLLASMVLNGGSAPACISTTGPAHRQGSRATLPTAGWLGYGSSSAVGPLAMSQPPAATAGTHDSRSHATSEVVDGNRGLSWVLVFGMQEISEK